MPGVTKVTTRNIVIISFKNIVARDMFKEAGSDSIMGPTWCP